MLKRRNVVDIEEIGSSQETERENEKKNRDKERERDGKLGRESWEKVVLGHKSS